MSVFKKLMGGAALGLLLASTLSAPAMAQGKTGNTPAASIDFGDDSGEWTKDGECDDPRFVGSGMASELVDADLLKDATDCRAAYEAGTITLQDEGANTAAIDFGDDTGEWSKDGECDDPRFVGSGMASELVDADLLKDATDCRTAYEAGTITLKDGPAAAADVAATEIDFGDDSSRWAKDGECDDPRFKGRGSASELVDSDLFKDATDCQAAYDAGTVTYVGDDTASAGTIDYGNDSSRWSKDGSCDDPRFTGSGVSRKLLDEDIGRDATDCRAAVEAGTASFVGGNGVPAVFDYGSNTSAYANDDECDDPRFYGPGTDKKLLSDDMYGDANDCKALEEQGQVSIRKVYTVEYAAGAPYDSSHIDFGDNSSSYSDDDMCDDPRFEGPGAASVLLDSDLEHDSADCKAAYEAGTIILITEAMDD